ncbi:MAG: RsmE family RNA methyltransferase, partial [Pyrinomonadaceae bacterium]
PESPLELTLAAAILPGEKFDLVVQKAVELGVITLQPLYTKRCEARPEGGGRRIDRWQKIALEAAKQSGRAKLMAIAEACQISVFLPQCGERSTSVESLILFSERDGSGFTAIKESEKITAVIGPKGGWADSELDQARDNGFSIITFGGRILRAETAAIAMSAILQHRFGDLS